MKTIKNLMNIILVFSTLVTLTSCNNKKSSNGSVVANTPYAISNGACRYTATQQVVDATYCQGNTGYSLNNLGQCIYTTTGQIVAANMCTASGGTQQCVGDYWIWNGMWTQVRCTGANCSRLTVYPNGATSELQRINCL